MTQEEIEAYARRTYQTTHAGYPEYYGCDSDAMFLVDHLPLLDVDAAAKVTEEGRKAFNDAMAHIEEYKKKHNITIQL